MRKNSASRGRDTGCRSIFCILSAVFCLLLTAPSARAAESYFSSESVGTTSGDFLNLPIGARAAAMGGAYTAVAEEASAIYWNPAGLVQIPKLSAIFMRTQYVADISYQYAAYAHRLNYSSVLAGSILLTDIGAIDHLNRDGTKIDTFSPRDQVFTLSYSKAILEFSDKDMDVSMGVSAKYIKSTILESAKSYAFDMGVMTYNFTNIPYRLGVTMSNLGSGLRYDEESNALPLTFKLAGSANPFKNMMFAFDVVAPKQNRPNFLFGTELATEPNELTRLCVRAGLNAQRIRDGISGFTVGVGATLHFFSLDYAFVPMGELGSIHKISLTFDFPFRSSIFQRRDRSIFSKMQGISFK